MRAGKMLGCKLAESQQITQEFEIFRVRPSIEVNPDGGVLVAIRPRELVFRARAGDRSVGSNDEHVNHERDL